MSKNSRNLLKLTIEQEQVIRTNVPILKVKAFAGATKTTTLVFFAEARPHARFLYVAFNKAIQMEAERKFPSNVISKTTHALAFPQYGSTYSKANKLVPGIRLAQLLQAFNLPNTKQNYQLVSDVMATVNAYMAPLKTATPRRYASACIWLAKRGGQLLI